MAHPNSRKYTVLRFTFSMAWLADSPARSVSKETRWGVSLLDGSLLSTSPSRVLSFRTLTQQLPWPPPSPPRQNRNPQPQRSPTPPPLTARTPPYPPRPPPPPLPTSRHRSSSTSTQSSTSSSTAPHHRPLLPLWPPTPNPVLGVEERRAVGWVKGGEQVKALGRGRARGRRSALTLVPSSLLSFPLPSPPLLPHKASRWSSCPRDM